MPQYKVYDSSARLVATVADVLAPVALTAVSTSSGSNLVTVASTTSCHVGMPVAIPNIPLGAFIYAIKDATTLELWAMSWNASTGVVTVSASNANASASGSSLLGRALGYCPFCIVPSFFLLGTWRNALQPTTMNYGGTSSASVTLTAPLEITTLASSPSYGAKGDEYATTPLKRHNGEPWGVRYFVSTNGLISSIPADPKFSVILSSAT